MDPDLAFRIVDILGVLANALLGAALARRHGFDLIGFLALAAVSALGGGLLRDMMLAQGFPVALTDPWYLGGAFGAAVVAHFVVLEGRWARRSLVVADVLALGCWSATGASKALSAGLGWVPAIFLGVVTAVAGGMLRDVLVQRPPVIFGGSPLYATFSVVAAFQMVLFQAYGHPSVGMASAIILCAVFGLLARRYRWMLPVPRAVTLRAIKRHRRATESVVDESEPPG